MTGTKQKTGDGGHSESHWIYSDYGVVGDAAKFMKAPTAKLWSFVKKLLT